MTHENLQAENNIVRVDLRGPWNHPLKGPIQITYPEQFVTYGITVSRDAIIQTPGWGEEALKSYDDALELAAQSNQVFRLHEQPYIKEILAEQSSEPVLLSDLDRTIEG